MPEYQPDKSSANAADQSAAQSPADRVKQLQEDLKNQEKDLAIQTKQRDAFKADVDSLAKTIGEIEKAKAESAKSLPPLIDEKEKLEKYQDEMRRAAETLLGEETKKIVDDKIKEVEKKISDQDAKLQPARELVRKTEDEARTAQEDLDKKQKSYDDFKNLFKDHFKQLNDLKSRIDKLNDVPKAASMYVLLREMHKVLTDTAIPANEDEFETQLTLRWTALVEAKERARTAKLASENAKTQLAADESTLAALKKSRVDDLVAETDEFNQ